MVAGRLPGSEDIPVFKLLLPEYLLLIVAQHSVVATYILPSVYTAIIHLFGYIYLRIIFKSMQFYSTLSNEHKLGFFLINVYVTN